MGGNKINDLKHKQRILVTGVNGQLGQEFAFLADQFLAFEFIFKTKAELNICDEVALDKFFATEQIDYCLNCAAYTAVDKAEKEEELAWKVNVKAVASIGEMCVRHDVQIIHFSTDYVYHDHQNIAYKETDSTHPQGVYATTKLEGEKQLQKVHPNAMIIRTSWVYSVFGHNFVRTMLRLGKEREELGIVCDQIGTPTNARDLAGAILQILSNVESDALDKSTLKGVFNYSNEGICSWYDFAQAIFEISGIHCKIKPIESKDYPTPAKRPPFSVLNKSKFKSTFNIEIPHWRESLKMFFE